mgnify:CR=1 FL=1
MWFNGNAWQVNRHYSEVHASRVNLFTIFIFPKNYKKHLKAAYELIDDKDKAEAFAKKRTKKDIYDAMQSLVRNLTSSYPNWIWTFHKGISNLKTIGKHFFKINQATVWHRWIC